MSQKKNKHKGANTKAVIQAVKRAFKKEGYEYDFHKEENTFVSGFNTDGVGISFLLIVRKEMMSFVCGPEFEDMFTNTGKLLPVLNELNSKIPCGSFYHKAESGRIFFEMGCPMAESDIGEKFFISLLDRALATAASGAKVIREKVDVSEEDSGSMYC